MVNTNNIYGLSVALGSGVAWFDGGCHKNVVPHMTIFKGELKNPSVWFPSSWQNIAMIL